MDSFVGIDDVVETVNAVGLLLSLLGITEVFGGELRVACTDCCWWWCLDGIVFDGSSVVEVVVLIADTSRDRDGGVVVVGGGATTVAALVESMDPIVELSPSA